MHRENAKGGSFAAVLGRSGDHVGVHLAGWSITGVWCLRVDDVVGRGKRPCLAPPVHLAQIASPCGCRSRGLDGSPLNGPPGAGLDARARALGGTAMFFWLRKAAKPVQAQTP